MAAPRTITPAARRRRTAITTVLAMVATLPVVGGSSRADPPSSPGAGTAPAPSDRPNVVVVLTDDQRDGTLSRMPNVWNRLRKKGVLYSNAAVPTSLCCPSRATILTGLYAHSTGVYSNVMPEGGWQTFHHNGMHRRTLATALDAVGYHTAHVGKYLNGRYDLEAAQGRQPPGWDEFVTYTTKPFYYDYALNDGRSYGSGPGDHSTDVLRDHAVRIIRSTPADEPLFLMYTPSSPHRPYITTPRNEGAFEGRLPSYRSPALTENLRDKPAWIQTLKPRRQQQVDSAMQRMQESLLDVDDAVGAFVDALEDTGRMDHTLFVYLSDNGVLLGEHRVFEWKNVPYRWATEIPMVVRWDGRVTPGSLDGRWALNVDVATTVAAASGALMKTEGLYLLGTVVRDGFVLEATREYSGNSPPKDRPAYCGFRTRRWAFVKYDDGTQELYDYASDPDELNNLADLPEYRARLRALTQQAKAACIPVPSGYTWPPG
jgi:arylsulfatase A-like enzyme